MKKIISLVLLLVFFQTGCASVEIGMSHKRPTSSNGEIDMVAMAKEEKALNNIEGIDNPAIMVDGKAITKRQIETLKITNSHTDLSEIEIIDSAVREFVLNLEAERLQIKPEQEKIDTIMEQNRLFLEEKQPGSEIDLAYIEEKGITLEEYLHYTEDVLYKMFQRDALREYVGIEDEAYSEEYEEYIDGLVKNADIEIVDPDIKKLYE